MLFSISSITAQTTRNVGVGQTYTTIQAAISAASDGDIINIVDAVHQETNITVYRTVTIQGQGAANTELKGNYISSSSPGSRIFYISPGKIVVIRDLKISRSGVPNGTNATIPGVSGSSGQSGGAIYNAGTLTVKRCHFYYNHAGNGGNGMTGSNGDNGGYIGTTPQKGGNGSKGGNGGHGGSGGAIANTATLNIIDCLFTNNSSGMGGNGADGGHGGVGADGYGGSPCDYDDRSGTSGGIGGNGGNAGNAGHGGAIANTSTSAITVIKNSTFSSNVTLSGGHAGNGSYGGFGGDSRGTAWNYGGWGGNGGNGGNAGIAGSGSAIWNCYGAEIDIVNGTIANNICLTINYTGNGGDGGVAGQGSSSYPNNCGTSGSGGNGGTGATQGHGAIYNTSIVDDFHLLNTIISNNSAAASGYLDGGAYGSYGTTYSPCNKYGDNGNVGAQGGLITVYPNWNASKFVYANTPLTETTLLDLADNGGPTFTMAILENGTADGAGASSGAGLSANLTDQRGFSRQSAPHGYDIGAYEYRNFSDNLVINEVDPHQNTDIYEFIEIYDGGDGNTNLDELVVVLYDGSNADRSYKTIDLTGYSTDANGYFVIGSSIVDNVDLVVTSGFIQNGIDAVALYKGLPTDFPIRTSVTTTNLIDALVYENDQYTDPGLTPLINSGQSQINENENGIAETESMQRIPNGTGGQRNTDTYVVYTPTPGTENILPKSLSASPTSLNFGYVQVGSYQIRSYTLTGENLTGNVSVWGDGRYQVSLTTDNFQDYIIIAPSSGSVNKTIYIKFSPASAIKYDNIVTNSSSGATTVNIAVTGYGVEPTIEVSQNSLDFGDVETDESVVMNYDLTGSYLNNDITVTAPNAQYKVSLSETSGFSSSIVVPETSGFVDETIYVQFTPTSPTTYSGNVTNVSSGATSQNVAVSGTGVGQIATLNTSVSSIEYPDTRVGERRGTYYSLTGDRISGDVTILCPAGYTVSLDALGTYESSLTFTTTSSFVKRIYVRFSPTAETTYSGNIVNSTTGATSKNVAVTGTGVVPVIAVSPSFYEFGNVQIGETAEGSYTLTGNNLAEDITITAPTNYKISETSGSGFVSSLSVTQISGEINTTIYVQYAPTSEGANDAMVTHASGTTTKNFGVYGDGVVPSITVSPTSLAFGEIEVDDASEKSYDLTAEYLTNNLTVTPPSGYEVSLSSGSGFSGSLDLNPSGVDNTINETIYVRFSPNSSGTFNSNISNSSYSATTKTVALTGIGFERTITTDPTSLDFGNVIVGESKVMSYTLTGVKLNDAGELIIDAPTGYLVSFSSTSGFTSSMEAYPDGNGDVSETIYVKFSPVEDTNYTNHVFHYHYQVSSDDLIVTGTGVVPSISIPASINFNTVQIGNSSEKSYNLIGTNLSTDITVTAFTGYQVSLTHGSGFANSVIAAHTNGSVDQIIYVKFSPTSETTYSGNITNVSSGATSQDVAVTGIGSNYTIPTINVNTINIDYSNISVGSDFVKEYTISGTDLTNDITISLNTGTEYTISKDNITFATDDIILTNSGGNVSETTIYVKYSPSASGTALDIIYNSSTDASTLGIALEGTSVVGLSENDNIKFSVFPNPSNGIFKIDNKLTENTDIFIYDVYGKLIQKNSLNSDMNTIDISKQSNGIYFIKIQTENGIISEKIIKQ